MSLRGQTVLFPEANPPAPLGRRLEPWLRTVSRVLQSIPSSLKGKKRLHRFFVSRAKHVKDIWLDGKLQTKFLVPDVCEPIAQGLFGDGFYEQKTIDTINHLIGSGGTFIDVGTNIGAITIPVSRMLGDKVKIISIEASPTILPYLKCNLAENEVRNVQLVEKAAFEKDGVQVPFYMPPPGSFGMGSISPQFSVKPVLCPTITIDTLVRENRLENVRVMKLDVEGAEATVLLGAQELLSRKDAPVIVFEFCDWTMERDQPSTERDAQQLLRRFGYQIWTLNGYLTGAAPLETNVTEGASLMLVAKK